LRPIIQQNISPMPITIDIESDRLYKMGNIRGTEAGKEIGKEIGSLLQK
jgi:hypothetical protein